MKTVLIDNAIKKLTKELRMMYTEEQLGSIKFSLPKFDKDTYSIMYEFKGNLIKLVYDFERDVVAMLSKSIIKSDCTTQSLI